MIKLIKSGIRTLCFFAVFTFLYQTTFISTQWKAETKQKYKGITLLTI